LGNNIPNNTDISIIIVTWNSEDDIPECLNSIYGKEYGFQLETIIIDNNSSDNSVKVVKNFNEMQSSDIKIIENKENTGFTIACNHGIRISTGQYVLLLNPDTEIIENSLELLYNKFEKENIYSAIAPKLLNEDGSIQLSCRTLPRYADLFSEIFLLSNIFPKSKIFSRWKMNYFSHNEIAEVEQPMAAALLLKKTVLNEIQNFDESYYMFFNDVDLCKKMYDNNYKILFYPVARFVHKKGTSIYKDRARMIKAWNSDCLNYFKKYHYSFLKYNLLKIFLKLTGSIRILFKL